MIQTIEQDTAQQLDYAHLACAYDIAARASGQTFPNPVVGAVIAIGKRVLATGYHRRAGAAHAEAVAIEQAHATASKAALRRATLYTTLEPCAYSGANKRTPPCVERIINAQIPRVVVGAIDPHNREQGRGMEILRKAGVAVTYIDMQARFIRQNEGYTVRMRHGRPLIELKLAQTADGYAADSFGQSRWISDRGARHFAHHLRAQHQAILVGTTTARTDNPQLSARFGIDRYPLRFVLDRTLTLPHSLHLLQTARMTTTYVVHDKRVHDERKIASLDKLGVRRIALDTQADNFYAELFAYLGTETICDSMLIEGGATTISAVLESEVWDKITLVISPTLLLGGSHIGSPRPQRMADIRTVDAATWYPLTGFDSHCLALRGYRNCEYSFGIASACYDGRQDV